MAILTADLIAKLSIPLLARSVVLPATVERVPESDFGGNSGDTVTVRVRGARTANVQPNANTAITLDTISETGVPVKVEHVYSAAALTEHDLTLSLENFGAQVLEPAIKAVSRKAEAYIATAMNGVTADATVAATPTADEYAAAIKDAGEALDNADVEAGGRYVAVSPGVARLLLDYPAIEDASALGTASAIQDATIGRYAGFTLVKSSALTAGSFCAYHRSAFVLANKAPQAVTSADSAIVNEEGYALRVVRDYDASKLSEIVAVSTFAGASVVDIDRAYRVTVGA
ncbi:phage capsid protein [Actinomadura citrea]|uniref:P22 phage major capsid protein family protein n=1 Tax=Actinomadura citrea TaxID=46158 RepID=UPI002E28FECF|nr:P22 phage major capsid protein family protein [Actinomadura citrea]